MDGMDEGLLASGDLFHASNPSPVNNIQAQPHRMLQQAEPRRFGWFSFLVLTPERE
jgi:hypothetical protein